MLAWLYTIIASFLAFAFETIFIIIIVLFQQSSIICPTYILCNFDRALPLATLILYRAKTVLLTPRQELHAIAGMNSTSSIHLTESTLCSRASNSYMHLCISNAKCSLVLPGSGLGWREEEEGGEKTSGEWCQAFMILCQKIGRTNLITGSLTWSHAIALMIARMKNSRKWRSWCSFVEIPSSFSHASW